MSQSKILTAILLVFILIGAAGRVFRPLKAVNVPAPKNTAVVAPASTTATLPTGSVTFGHQVFSVEIAATDAEKAQGLSDRASLATNAGMLFIFDPASQPDFWMKDMRFALDFVWIANGRVAGINRNVPAPQPGTATLNLPTYAAPEPVDYVLEINAGAAATLRVGDEATIINSKSI